MHVREVEGGRGRGLKCGVSVMKELVYGSVAEACLFEGVCLPGPLVAQVHAALDLCSWSSGVTTYKRE